MTLVFLLEFDLSWIALLLVLTFEPNPVANPDFSPPLNLDVSRSLEPKEILLLRDWFLLVFDWTESLVVGCF